MAGPGIEQGSSPNVSPACYHCTTSLGENSEEVGRIRARICERVESGLEGQREEERGGEGEMERGVEDDRHGNSRPTSEGGRCINTAAGRALTPHSLYGPISDASGICRRVCSRSRRRILRCHQGEASLVQTPVQAAVFTRQEMYLHQHISTARHHLAISLSSFWSPSGVEFRLLASHVSEPGSILLRSRSQIFARGKLAGRCRWSTGFLRDLPFPPLLQSGAAPYSLHFPLHFLLFCNHGASIAPLFNEVPLLNSHVEVALDGVTNWRVLSGFSHFPRPLNSGAPFHAYLPSPSSALKTPVSFFLMPAASVSSRMACRALSFSWMDLSLSLTYSWTGDTSSLFALLSISACMLSSASFHTTSCRPICIDVNAGARGHSVSLQAKACLLTRARYRLQPETQRLSTQDCLQNVPVIRIRARAAPNLQNRLYLRHLENALDYWPRFSQLDSGCGEPSRSWPAAIKRASGLPAGSSRTVEWLERRTSDASCERSDQQKGNLRLRASAQRRVPLQAGLLNWMLSLAKAWSIPFIRSSEMVSNCDRDTFFLTSCWSAFFSSANSSSSLSAFISRMWFSSSSKLCNNHVIIVATRRSWWQVWKIRRPARIESNFDRYQEVLQVTVPIARVWLCSDDTNELQPINLRWLHRTSFVVDSDAKYLAVRVPRLLSFGRLLTARSPEPMRVIESSSEQRRNKGTGGSGRSSRKTRRPAASSAPNPHVQKSGGDPAGDCARFPLVGGEQANRSATAAPALFDRGGGDLPTVRPTRLNEARPIARYGACSSGGHVVDVLTYHFLKPNSAHRPRTASITYILLPVVGNREVGAKGIGHRSAEASGRHLVKSPSVISNVNYLDLLPVTLTLTPVAPDSKNQKN
ncbi:hypothetical protein PR048_002678 [Dryococelus australis]|uniref:Uncharacterized protein n=1 Tax=Dryococelus australis TaxID=614101 RepID=A0ABQ9IKX1_9NEOP|nr:hypothetical protein PR048_002678 [Dryococelus australis]